MKSARTYDAAWDEIYGGGAMMNRYPYDIVVQFIYRNAPRNKERRAVKILEVGCGAANNLWFAAREGFTVTGIDGSADAIAHAQKRFAAELLEGDLRVGDMTNLPFDSATFDMVIDRGAITCLPFSAAALTVKETLRVLLPGGLFLFNPYSKSSTSFPMSEAGEDGLRKSIHGGTLTGVGEICFYGRDDVSAVLGAGWSVESLDHLELTREIPEAHVHAEWRVIARKQQ